MERYNSSIRISDTQETKLSSTLCELALTYREEEVERLAKERKHTRREECRHREEDRRRKCWELHDPMGIGGKVFISLRPDPNPIRFDPIDVHCYARINMKTKGD